MLRNVWQMKYIGSPSLACILGMSDIHPLTTIWINPPTMAPTLMRRCYRSIPNGVLTAHDLGGLQCEVAS